MIMSQQDEQLDHIASSMGTLKNMSRQIGQEVDEQAVWVLSEKKVNNNVIVWCLAAGQYSLHTAHFILIIYKVSSFVLLFETHLDEVKKLQILIVVTAEEMFALMQ